MLKNTDLILVADKFSETVTFYRDFLKTQQLTPIISSPNVGEDNKNPDFVRLQMGNIILEIVSKNFFQKEWL